MWAVIDCTTIGGAPLRDSHTAHALFCILWIILGSVLLLNLFVGVLVNIFADMKRQEEEGTGEGSMLMTDEQRQWVESMSSMIELKPIKVAPCPPGPLRAWCYRLIMARRFEGFILGVIIFNTLLMALDGYGELTMPSAPTRSRPSASRAHSRNRPSPPLAPPRRPSPPLAPRRPSPLAPRPSPPRLLLLLSLVRHPSSRGGHAHRAQLRLHGRLHPGGLGQDRRARLLALPLRALEPV